MSTPSGAGPAPPTSSRVGAVMGPPDPGCGARPSGWRPGPRSRPRPATVTSSASRPATGRQRASQPPGGRVYHATALAEVFLALQSDLERLLQRCRRLRHLRAEELLAVHDAQLAA